MEVTEKQLAAALDGFYVRVRSTAGGMGTSSAQLADADETAKTLFATLSRMAAERGPWDVDEEDDRDVVDAHICCDHAAGPYVTRGSVELRAADQIIALLDHRGERVVKRVLTWVWDYLTDGDEPPF